MSDHALQVLIVDDGRSRDRAQGGCWTESAVPSSSVRRAPRPRRASCSAKSPRTCCCSTSDAGRGGFALLASLDQPPAVVFIPRSTFRGARVRGERGDYLLKPFRKGGSQKRSSARHDLARPEELSRRIALLGGLAGATPDRTTSSD
jgi:hypothetical protein